MSEQRPGQVDETIEGSRKTLRREMAVQRAVELSMNSLIQGMEQLVDGSHVADSQMEKHQVKNLLAVALETPSVEVVTHYILYQVGRDVAGTSWRKDEFGRNLARALGALRQDAERISRQTNGALELGEASAAEIDETWMALVRAYLGQFNRYFYYCKEATRWQPETR